MGKITACLAKYQENQNECEEALYSLTYEKLKRIAAKRLRSSAPVSATELVHEAWLRLSNVNSKSWVNSKHFFNAAASAMRYALIDSLRNQNRIKRGSGYSHQAWSDSLLGEYATREEVEQLHEALTAFELEHPQKAEIVTMKFFGGMTVNEISHVTGLSSATVERYWKFSKAWLYRHVAE